MYSVVYSILHIALVGREKQSDVTLAEISQFVIASVGGKMTRICTHCHSQNFQHMQS